MGSAGPEASRRASGDQERNVRLGLRANLGQFSILVLLNAFVGAMVGLERTVLPLVGTQQFGLASTTAVLSFIASFGLSKALINLAAGAVADRVGRRRVLMVGWLLGIPVPVLILVAPSWGWVVAANLLLGANQALCWSMTVNMKIDLVGPARRGLALGLNESAGYAAVGLATLAAAAAAAAYGLRSGPFGLGIGIPIVGLALTVLLVRDTSGHVAAETEQLGGPQSPPPPRSGLGNILAFVSWRDRDLFACSQAGLVNNLNDGMAWGLLPIFLSRAGLTLGAIALITAAYPLSWGVLQLGTGSLSDRLGRKPLIVAGMALQGVALLAMVKVQGEGLWLATAIALGLGTALVYPTLLAAVSDLAHPSWRASAVGVYRMWRDLGYVVGALAAGLIADVAGIPAAITAVALVTLASALLTLLRLRETLPTHSGSASSASF
jgi:MFS family permease